jgi:hypothetical protein
MRIIKITITALLLYCASIAINDYLSVIKFQKIKEEQEIIATDKKEARKNNLTYKSIYHNNLSYFENPKSDSKIKLNAASLASFLVKQSKDQVQIEKYNCQAINYLESAIKQKPTDSGLALQLLDLKIENPELKCGIQIKPDQYKSILKTATKNAGNSAMIIRSAVTIYLKLQKLKESLKQIKKLQRFTERDPLIDQLVKYFITQKQALDSLIPDRYMQVLHWSGVIKNEFPDLFINKNQELEKLQLASLENIEEEKFTDEQAVYYLGEFSRIAVTPAVQSYIDLEMLKYLDANTDYQLIEYFKNRSKLDRIPTICGLTYGDSRPHESNLIEWGADYFTYLDNDYQSVGCYLGGRQFNYYEISSQVANNRLIQEDLEIYLSDDNYTWKKFQILGNSQFITWSNYTISTTTLMAPIQIKYIKVRYKRNLVQRTFGNKLQELLSFYE